MKHAPINVDQPLALTTSRKKLLPGQQHHHNQSENHHQQQQKPLLKVCTTGFRGQELEYLVLKLREHRCEYEKSLTMGTNVLIAQCMQSIKGETARVKRIPTVTQNWVLEGHCDTTLLSVYAAPVLLGVMLSSSGIVPISLRRKVEGVCEANGGSYQPMLTKDCHYLVVPTSGANFASEKVAFARKNDIRLLTVRAFFQMLGREEPDGEEEEECGNHRLGITTNTEGQVQRLEKATGSSSHITALERPSINNNSSNELLFRASMSDCVCYCTPVTAVTPAVRQLLYQASIKRVPFPTEQTTHIIVLERSFEYLPPSIVDSCACVSLDWVKECIRMKSCVEPHAFFVAVPSTPVITLASFCSNEAADFSRYISELGGKVQSALVLGYRRNPPEGGFPTSHLVVQENSLRHSPKVKALAERYQETSRMECHLVKPEWVKQSYLVGKWLDCSPYEYSTEKLKETLLLMMATEEKSKSTNHDPVVGSVRTTTNSSSNENASIGVVEGSTSSALLLANKNSNTANNSHSSGSRAHHSKASSGFVDTQLTTETSATQYAWQQHSVNSLEALVVNLETALLTTTSPGEKAVDNNTREEAHHQGAHPMINSSPSTGKTKTGASDPSKHVPLDDVINRAAVLPTNHNITKPSSVVTPAPAHPQKTSLASMLIMQSGNEKSTLGARSLSMKGFPDAKFMMMGLSHSASSFPKDSQIVCYEHEEILEAHSPILRGPRSAAAPTAAAGNLSLLRQNTKTDLDEIFRNRLLKLNASNDPTTLLRRRQESERVVESKNNAEQKQQEQEQEEQQRNPAIVVTTTEAGLSHIKNIKKFLVSGGIKTEFEPLILSIGEGCEVIDRAQEATHYIVAKPAKTEALLSAIAGGKWVVTKEYVLDSLQQKHWLDEVPYEWNSSRLVEGELTSLGTIMDGCPLQRGIGGRRYASWKVVLCCTLLHRGNSFANVLRAGGCQEISIVELSCEEMKEGGCDGNKDNQKDFVGTNKNSTANGAAAMATRSASAGGGKALRSDSVSSSSSHWSIVQGEFISSPTHVLCDDGVCQRSGIQFIQKCLLVSSVERKGKIGGGISTCSPLVVKMEYLVHALATSSDDNISAVSFDPLYRSRKRGRKEVLRQQ